MQDIFSSIAENYDLANRLITLGLDSFWRKKLVSLSPFSEDSFILDCASGTGKLALAFLKKLGVKGRVIGVDFCEKMLSQVQVQDSRIQFQKADVLNLPFDSQTFDVVSMAYGLRNLSDMEKGLKEMARAAKPQGWVMVLETGSSFIWPFSFIFQFYFKKAVPLLGGWAAGNKSAYQYLQKSSMQFPCGKEMTAVFEKTNKFKSVQCFRILGGASYIYKAQVR